MPDDTKAPLPPTTTAEQDITTAAQRRVNMVWEYTQAAIAITVVIANISVQVFIVVTGMKTPIPESLSNVLFLIVGFYFSRADHAAMRARSDVPSSNYPFYRDTRIVLTFLGLVMLGWNVLEIGASKIF